MIFCDASVLLAAEDTDDLHHEAAARLLELGEPLATLDLAAYEVTNVAVRRWLDTSAANRLRDRVFAIAEYGELVRVDREIVDVAVEIAEETGISVYDAAYVSGARRVGAELASCDLHDLVDRGLGRLPDAFIAGSGV